MSCYISITCIYLCIVGVRVVARNDTQSFTIRHSACQILPPKDVSNRHFKQCQTYNTSLQAHLSRHTNRSASKDPTNSHSHTSFKHLDKESLTSRSRQLSTHHKSTNQRMKDIQAKVESLLERDSLTADLTLDGHCAETGMSHLSNLSVEDSFKRDFWEQQFKVF